MSPYGITSPSRPRDATYIWINVPSNSSPTHSLPETMMTYCQLDIENKLHQNFNHNTNLSNFFLNIMINKMSAILSLGPFYKHGLTLIRVWISNCVHYKVWDEIPYQFPNCDACKKVWEWISNFIPHIAGHVITYQTMLVKVAPGLNVLKQESWEARLIASAKW